MTDLIAVDLGNESGRVMGVHFNGSRLSSREIYRFANNPVMAGGILYWDALRLWHEIQQGLARALSEVKADGIAVDSFGVDFGLLDAKNRLISNPVHMRDSRTDGIMDWVYERVPRQAIFERTGIGCYVINTLYQLAAIQRDAPWQLEAAHMLLTIPNLYNFWLTGEKLSEYTHTTTTQCYNPLRADWDYPTLKALGIPTRILPQVVQPGQRIGSYQRVPVYSVASHDTASAVLAVPTQTPNYAYLSSGTWSLLGVEVREPVINPAALAANVTNEGGYGAYRLLKLVMGLWIYQQCRTTWQGQNLPHDHETLLQLAAAEPPFAMFIDPDDSIFFAPGDMPGRVRAFCERTGQVIPQNVGAVVRCIMESLALKYRYVLE